MSELVTYQTEGNLALITLNRPEARNAVNPGLAEALESAVDQMEDDPDVWIGILRANTEGQSNPVFCAGADLKAISAGQMAGVNTERGGFGGFAFRQRKKPVIAAIDGLATAGGCEIALACDMIVATNRSAFGLAEVKRNLIAAAGGLYRLTWAIGKAAAMEVILTGDPLPAARAYELGMVSRLVDDGQAEAEARRLAERICANAPLAVWASREIVNAASENDEATLRALTTRRFSEVTNSEDTREGLTAFIEKRAPKWQGR